LKILFSQKIAGISGSEVYYLNLLPALKEMNIDVEFLCLTPYKDKNKNKKFISILEKNKIKVYTIEIYNDLSFSLIKRINYFLNINKNKYDFIHTNLIHADFYFSIIKLLFNRKLKIVSTKHSFDSNGYQKKYGFKPKKYKFFNKFILMSKFSEKFILKTIVISHGLKKLLIGLNIRKDIDVIHYGFRFKNVVFSKKKSKYRKSNKQILIIGRLIDVKGHIYALKAMKTLAEQFHDLSLVIVGNGELENYLKKNTQDLNLQSKVFFEGHSDSVHDYINNSDIVLVTSKAEGFGVILLESFMYGCPVVGWDVPAINEIVENNISGYLVEPYNINKLHNAIVKMISLSKNNRKEMASNGKKRVDEYFTIDRMVLETIEVYNKVMQNT